jgi:site-specific DNA recombinase
VKAAAYVRVSTDEQAQRGLSLAEQREQISEHITKAGWQEFAVYEDRGYSGARADRPGLVRLLADREDYDVLVVWALDRLGRDLTLLATTVGKLRDAGVRLEVLSGGVELDSAEGELHFHVRAAVSQYERQMIARRGRMAAEAIARQGRYNGPRPTGYRFEDSLLVPVPHEVEIVHRVFSEYAGGRGFSEIARGLNADSIPTVRRGKWRVATLRAMLTNPLYIGRVRFRGEEREGQHEGIIERELWDRVQALIRVQTSSKGKARGRKPKGPHLFTRGLLRCGECGQAMVPRSYWGEQYLCNGRQVLGCEMPVAQRAEIDAAVYAYFERVGLDVEATRRSLAEARESKLREIRALLVEARQEERRSQERLSRVRRDYQDGRLDPEDWVEHRQELTAELEAAGAEAERLREQEAAVESWAELSDVEQATFERLSELRRVIAGEAKGEIDSVRAALGRIFEQFVLHRADSGSAPKRLHAELAMVGDGGFVIEPVVREEAIEGYSETMRPVLRREVITEDKERQAVGYRLLDP